MIKEANLCTAFFPMGTGGSRTCNARSAARRPKGLRRERKDLGVKIVSGVLSREHVHMLVEIPPHIALSDFLRTVITSGTEEFPGIAKALLGAAFLGSGLLLHHERQHHGRCHTSVSSGVRTYRRQAVGIQLLSSKSRPRHRGEITGDHRECRPRSPGAARFGLSRQWRVDERPRSKGS